jgi:hypothetical protein
MLAQQMHQRYGGFLQSQPLSDAEKKYDDTMRHLDEIEAELGDLPLAVWKAGEFMWFNHHVAKLHIAPRQEALDFWLKELIELRDALLQRSQPPRPAEGLGRPEEIP